MKVTSLFIFILLFLSNGAWGQGRKPATIAELATYRGADRETLLYAGAKTEGRIVWYTSLAGDSYKELVKAFENKQSGDRKSTRLNSSHSSPSRMPSSA